MKEFVAADIAPILACVLALVRFLVPTREVLTVRRDGNLGELNPVPFCAAILNTSGWVAYSVLEGDLFIFFGDAPGLLCSIWMTFSLFPHASRAVQDRLTGFIMTAAAVWCILAMVTIILQSTGSGHAVTPLWGWAVSVTQVLLMASPLSTIYKAIQQRTSASFHLGLCAMGLVTSTMWVIFSLTINNLFVMVPNMVGGAMSLLALLVCIVLPRTPPRTPAEQQQARMRGIEQAVELGR
ncbi:hypothetical protein CVIRNUC_000372 [Coccomyxa viridis]|uniref:Bidirectional sugar transporter SWEET n=1 Tax=Coccomyxa viridis TaxID=1274662 RepID=A0AAV1HUN9_9CHLO|nr:hypothetical protein CVIRNUC_000372 [Coccomyxa viridis]